MLPYFYFNFLKCMTFWLIMSNFKIHIWNDNWCVALFGFNACLLIRVIHYLQSQCEHIFTIMEVAMDCFDMKVKIVENLYITPAFAAYPTDFFFVLNKIIDLNHVNKICEKYMITYQFVPFDLRSELTYLKTKFKIFV